MQHAEPATAEDLLGLDDPEHRCDLVRGELRRMSRPSARHGLIAMQIGIAIGRHAQERDLGAVFSDTGFLLARGPDTVRGPDVAFVRRERMPRPLPPGFFPGAPDLAVEVVSPNDRFVDVEDKARDWLAHSSIAVWIVNPSSRTVTRYRRDDARILSGDDVLAEADLLPGLALRVGDVFPD